MKSSFFSGSFGGDVTKIAAGTRLECKVCWYVYDPGAGDETRQIDPGTAFAGLPADWSCPTCSGNKSDFMIIED